MPRIAVCDNTILDLSFTVHMLLDYHDVMSDGTPEVVAFSRADMLMDALDAGDRFNAFVIDAEGADVNGIELTQNLRDRGIELPVVIMSSTTRFAMDAYNLRAIRYLIKPIARESLYEALDVAMLLYGRRRRERYYYIKTPRGIVRTRTGDIVCVESISRALQFTLRSGECISSVCLRGSFEEQLSELLCDPSFVYPHKSYLVNMKYVQSACADKLQLSSGRTIPISRRNAAETRKTYVDYIEHINGWCCM